MSNYRKPGRRGRGRAGDDARSPGKFPALSALIRGEAQPPGLSAKAAAGTKGKAAAQAQAEGGTRKRGKYKKDPGRFRKDEPDPGPLRISEVMPWKQFKRLYMEWALCKVKGDVEEAARQARISKKTFYNWFPGAGSDAGRSGPIVPTGSIIMADTKQPTIGDAVLFGYKQRPGRKPELVPYPAMVVSISQEDGTLGLFVFTAMESSNGAVAEWHDHVSYSPTPVAEKWTPRPEAPAPSRPGDHRR